MGRQKDLPAAPKTIRLENLVKLTANSDRTGKHRANSHKIKNKSNLERLFILCYFLSNSMA